MGFPPVRLRVKIGQDKSYRQDRTHQKRRRLIDVETRLLFNLQHTRVPLLARIGRVVPSKSCHTPVRSESLSSEALTHTFVRAKKRVRAVESDSHEGYCKKQE